MLDNRNVAGSSSSSSSNTDVVLYRGYLVYPGNFTWSNVDDLKLSVENHYKTNPKLTLLGLTIAQYKECFSPIMKSWHLSNLQLEKVSLPTVMALFKDLSYANLVQIILESVDVEVVKFIYETLRARVDTPARVIKVVCGPNIIASIDWQNSFSNLFMLKEQYDSSIYNQCVSLQNTINDLSANNTGLEEELEELKYSSRDDIKKLNAKLTTITSELEKEKTNTIQLKEKLAEKKKKLKKVKNEFLQVQEEKLGAQEETKETQEETHAAQEETKRVREELIKVKEELENVKQEKLTEQAETQAARVEINTARAETQAANAETNAIREELKKIQDELMNSQEKLKMKEKDLNNIVETSNKTNADLIRANKSLEKEQEKTLELREKLNKIQGELTIKNGELKSAHTLYGKLLEKNGESDRRVKRLKIEIEKHKNTSQPKPRPELQLAPQQQLQPAQPQLTQPQLPAESTPAIKKIKLSTAPYNPKLFQLANPQNRVYVIPKKKDPVRRIRNL